MKSRPEIIKDNRKELTLGNGCRILVKHPSCDAARGHDIDFLIIPEAAHIKDLYKFWMMSAAVFNSNKDFKCIMYSTPYYENDFFHELWEKSTQNPFSDFNPITIHWSKNPFCNIGLHTILDKNGNQKLTSPWYEKICRDHYRNDENVIKRELDLGFVPKKIIKQSMLNVRIPIHIEEQIKIKLSSSKEFNTTSDYIRHLIEQDLQN